MTTIDFLKNQIIETRNFTKKLIDETPADLWYVIPEGTDSNFARQIGHIFMAQNFHLISCVFGLDEKIMKKIPLRQFSKIFGGLGSKNRSVDYNIVNNYNLIEYLNFILDCGIEKLEQSSDDILFEALEPTLFKNPIAKNKYEAISWSFKHEMWHCAEMEQVKVALDKPFEWVKK